MPWLAAVAAVGGGIAGNLIESSDRQDALNMNKEALKQWLDVYLPDPEAQKIALEQFVQTGTFTPELEKAIKQDPTAFDQIQVDPRLKDSQMRSLSSLENLGYGGGFDLQDKAGLQRALTDTATADRGRRESLANSFQQRGLGGSGIEMAAQLQGAQATGDRVGQMQLDVEAQRRKRALDAIMGAGQMAGSMRSQDYGEQADKARARDAISEFNTRNMQSVGQRNIDRQNEAQRMNLGERQRIADANVGLRNQQEMYNKGLSQQDFQNRMNLAAGRANALTGNAAQINANANANAGMWTGIGSDVAKGINSYYKNPNNRSKANAPDDEEEDSYLGGW